MPRYVFVGQNMFYYLFIIHLSVQCQMHDRLFANNDQDDT